MLPPPTTRHSSWPCLGARRFRRRAPATASGSMPNCPCPIKASPDSLSRIRLKRGRVIGFEVLRMQLRAASPLWRGSSLANHYRPLHTRRSAVDPPDRRTVADPSWFPLRYDGERDEFHFARIPAGEASRRTLSHRSPARAELAAVIPRPELRGGAVRRSAASPDYPLGPRRLDAAGAGARSDRRGPHAQRAADPDRFVALACAFPEARRAGCIASASALARWPFARWRQRWSQDEQHWQRFERRHRGHPGRHADALPANPA